MGDACDPCINDAANDMDGDGLCADQDPCPTDPRNDANKNGVCDTMECAAAKPPNCPPVCTCAFGTGGFFGVDQHAAVSGAARSRARSALDAPPTSVTVGGRR